MEGKRKIERKAECLQLKQYVGGGGRRLESSKSTLATK